MSKKNKSPEEKAARQAAKEERNQKRLAAVEAKTKARKEAQEKGLPWNDAIHAARFLEDYDAAFMSAIAGEPKVAVTDLDVVAGVNQNPEADQPPVQKPVPTAAELVRMAKEAVGRTVEETPIVTGETANDNSEEIEPLTTTGVSVTTENPVSDTSAEEAPDNSYDPANPATWLTDTNGGLIRLPSESNNKYNKRKNLFKNWKKTQTSVDAETVGRNDELPKTKRYPTGELIYNSDEDGQSLTPPTKSAVESANVFEAAAMGQTDEPATETPAEQPAEQVPSEEVAQPEPATETPVDEPVVQTEAVVTPDKPVEAKPTLTLATSQTEEEALANRAQKFYGNTWAPERAEKLTKAFKFLEMAIRLQQKGESDSRVNMPMTSAIRLETEALGITVAVAKAA